MFRILLTLFILIPIVEIYLLIKVGEFIGAPATVFMVVLTAALGVMLLRQQGLSTLARVQDALARGELPAVAMLEGVVLVFCGALLLTPGFFTDAIGFLGLVPPLRRRLVLSLVERGILTATRRGSKPRGTAETGGPRTLEGDYRREDDDF